MSTRHTKLRTRNFHFQADRAESTYMSNCQRFCLLLSATEMNHGQHFTFCCLDHSDFNSHFNNLSTSNPSLTFSEPHKPKHTLSTLSFKYDSMCHRKICIEQNIITEIPESTWQGIPSFQRVPSDHCGLFHTVSPVSMKNSDILDFYRSLTMNNGKLHVI